MTFDELVEVLEGLPGRMVEATVSTTEDGNERQHFAAFSGAVDKITRWKAPTEHWTIWWADDGVSKPSHGSVTVWRNGYESAEVKGSGRTLEEVEAGDDDETGTLWEILIRQSGMLVELLVYL